MTEQEWLASTNPREMLEFLGGEAGDRKLRLFACACCRQVWNPFVSPFTIRVVTAAEAFADGAVSKGAFRRLRDTANTEVVTVEQAPDVSGYLVHVTRAAAFVCSEDVRWGVTRARVAALRAAADYPAGYPATGRPVELTRNAESRAEQMAQAG